jgi:hypothetical protein
MAVHSNREQAQRNREQRTEDRGQNRQRAERETRDRGQREQNLREQEGTDRELRTEMKWGTRGDKDRVLGVQGSGSVGVWGSKAEAKT